MYINGCMKQWLDLTLFMKSFSQFDMIAYDLLDFFFGYIPIDWCAKTLLFMHFFNHFLNNFIQGKKMKKNPFYIKIYTYWKSKSILLHKSTFLPRPKINFENQHKHGIQ